MRDSKLRFLYRKEEKPVTVKEFLSIRYMDSAVLVAGKSGLHNSCAQFIVDNTVGLTSSPSSLYNILLLHVGKPQNMDLYSYLQLKIQQQASGIVFTADTAEEVRLDPASIDLCNRSAFPVIVYTAHIPSRVLMQRVLPYFAICDENAYSQNILLKKLCYETSKDIITEVECDMLNYNHKLLYCPWIIQLCGRENEGSFQDEVELLNIQSVLLDALDNPYTNAISFFDLNKQVCFVPYSPQIRWSVMKTKIQAAFQKVITLYPPEQQFRLGVGTPIHSIDDLPQGFNAALTAIQIGGRIKKDPRVCFYDASFMYKLILASPEKELRQFMQLYLGPILDDEQSIQTLSMYYGENSNLKDTANALGIHVNTLRSRLENISFLLDQDIKKTENRMGLSMALTIRHYFMQ